MSKPVTIFLVNFHSTCNAGDAGMLEVTLQLIRREFDSPRILIAADWPEEARYSELDLEVVGTPYHVTSVGPGSSAQKKILKAILGAVLGWLVSHRLLRPSAKIIPARWKRLFDAYLEADLVAAVAGNIFGSTGKWGWPFPVSVLALELAHWFRKPLYILPETIGPLKRGWERTLLKTSLSKARIIFLRDASSMDLAKIIQIPLEKTVYFPDLAFDLDPADRESAVATLQEFGYKSGEPALGMTIINWFSHTLDRGQVSSYYQSLATAVARLIQKYQVSVYLFSQVNGPTALENDHRANEIVYQFLCDLGLSSKVSIMKTVSPPATLKACYGMMDIFLASRLHSGIFAISMGVPTVFVGYLSKTRGMLKSLGLEEWVIDLGSANSDNLFEKLEQAWQHKEAISAGLQNIMPGIRAEISTLAARIREDYESLSS